MDKNLVLRKVISVTVSFILALCLLALSLIAALTLAVSPSSIKRTADIAEYDKLSFASLKTELEDITIPSGLPIDFFEERLDRTLYDARVKESFRASSTGGAVTYTKEQITKEFYDMAYEFALTQNRVVSDEAKEALQGFAEECSLRYIKYVNPSSVKLVLSYILPLKKLLLFALAAATLLSLAAASLLYLLCRGRSVFKHFFFSFASAFLLSGVLPLILLVSGEIKKIALTSPALHALTVCYAEGILKLMLIFAIIYAVVCALLLFLDIRSAKKEKQ